MTDLMSTNQEEVVMLTGAGYEPAYIDDIREGDEIAIPPVSRYFQDGLQMLTVQRILQPSPSVHGVVSFTADSPEGLNHHQYGAAYPVWIIRNTNR